MPSPNVLLDELRELANIDPQDEGLLDWTHEELCDAFKRMDKLLSNGGELPREWSEAKKP